MNLDIDYFRVTLLIRLIVCLLPAGAKLYPFPSFDIFYKNTISLLHYYFILLVTI